MKKGINLCILLINNWINTNNAIKFYLISHQSKTYNACANREKLSFYFIQLPLLQKLINRTNDE